jgi:hypothetical protein
MLSAMDQTEREQDSAAPPSGFWRNWYRSRVDHNTTEGPRLAGDEWPGEQVYATQDEAEGAANAMIEIRREVFGPDFVENAIYLGAFEEETDA